MSMIDSFIPFDIKCKKLNLKMKNSWKCIFRASRMMSFSYFLQIMGLAHNTFKNLWGSCYHIQFKPLQHLRWITL